jgi:hypothetical protein
MAKSTPSGKGKRQPASGKAVIVVELTEAEADALRSAVKKYRQTIPVYIESRLQEAKIIDRVLRKLK